MIKVLNQTNSVINQFLFELRHKDIQKDRGKFRNNLKRLGMAMAYEISKTLDYKKTKVETPLGTAEVNVLKSEVILMGILRASLPFYQGFQEVFDQAQAGFVGAARNEREDISVDMGYVAIPPFGNPELIIVDPMLATGKSMVQTIKNIENIDKASGIHIACAVAAPEGIGYLARSFDFENLSLWVAAVDDNLNEKAYIVPGLGDAGDLSFGEKI